MHLLTYDCVLHPLSVLLRRHHHPLQEALVVVGGQAGSVARGVVVCTHGDIDLTVAPLPLPTQHCVVAVHMVQRPAQPEQGPGGGRPHQLRHQATSTYFLGG